jgi:WD40 repeat protein
MSPFPVFSTKLVVLSFLCVVLALGGKAQADDPSPGTPKPTGLPVAPLQRETAVDFEKEILPFLKNNCLACHNTTKAKGGLNLETPQLIRKGGDTGPAVEPGKSDTSLMFKAATHLDPELIMPPKDNKANASDLKPEQLALLKLWIEQGAKGEVHASTPVNWLERPPPLDPILAVALTRDGQYAASGRGNEILVYHVPTSQQVAHLTDPKFSATTGLTHAAHRDLVTSLAFNAEGTLLASAAYREVKLWRRPAPAQKPAIALEESARTAVLSPDHKWLATVTASEQIVLHDMERGQKVHTLTGHSNHVLSVAFSADSRRLASSGADQTIRVWTVADGKESASIVAATNVLAMAWLGDGKQLACGDVNGWIQLWDVAEGELKPARDWEAHAGAVTALALLPGAKQLVSGGRDGLVRKWELENAKALREFKLDSAVVALALRPDGKRVAASGTNRLTRLWNLEDGKLVADLRGDRYAEERVGETERTLTIAKGTADFHKKALETAETEAKKQTERVATATATNTFTEKVFLEKEKALRESRDAKATAERELQELLARIKKVTEEYESADQAAKQAVTKARSSSEKAAQAQLAADRGALARTDAERIAAEAAVVATRSRATVDTTDAAKDTARRIAEESAAVAERSKAFAEAVAADAEMKSKLSTEAKTSVEKAIEEVSLTAFAAGKLKPNYDQTLAEAPEKRKQATNKIDSTTKALDGADKEFKRAETRKSVTGHELELALQSAERASNKVASAKATLESSEQSTRQTADRLAADKKAATAAEQSALALTFSPDGRSLAAQAADGRIFLWQSASGMPIDVLRKGAGAEASNCVGMAFLDNQTVLASSGEKALAAWSLRPAWTLERTLGTGDIDSPLADRVNAVRFSPDGKRLATGGGEPTRSGEIQLWRVDDGSLAASFTNIHSDAVLALDFSPDGKHLASASADRFVRVLNLESGKIERAFEGHTSYVLGVAWKSDSRTLASAGADNIIKIWDFTTGERKKNIEGASKEVTSIAYVGITDQTVATSGDNQVRIVRENGDKVRGFEGPSDFMNSAATTANGKIIAAGGQDGVLRVWADDGSLITNLTPQPGGE